MDKVALVEREAVVDAGGDDEEVLGLDSDPDPAFVALLCEVGRCRVSAGNAGGETRRPRGALCRSAASHGSC